MVSWYNFWRVAEMVGATYGYPSWNLTRLQIKVNTYCVHLTSAFMLP